MRKQLPSIIIILTLASFTQAYIREHITTFLRAHDAISLNTPASLLLQFAITLPILLRVTNLKLSDIGLNFRSLKHGALLTLKYFSWIIVGGALVAFMQAYPAYSRFSGYNWTPMRFIAEGWEHFLSILLLTALWEEVLTRGLFYTYLTKSGYDEPIHIGKHLKLNKAILISSLLFGALHIYNFIHIRTMGAAIGNTIITLGAVLVGYILCYIRQKTGSLVWPILAHTIANFSEWVVRVLVPILLANSW